MSTARTRSATNKRERERPSDSTGDDEREVKRAAMLDKQPSSGVPSNYNGVNSSEDEKKDGPEHQAASTSEDSDSGSSLSIIEPSSPIVSPLASTHPSPSSPVELSTQMAVATISEVTIGENVPEERSRASSTASAAQNTQDNHLATDIHDANRVPQQQVATESAVTEEALLVPSYVDVELKKRLQGLLDFVDQPSNCYPVAQVPELATWGGTSTDDTKFVGLDLERTLCVDGKPAIIRFAGVSHTPWFVSISGEPHKRVNIGIKLLRAVDLEAAHKLLFQRANPPITPTDPSSIIYAARLMTRRKKGDTTSQIYPFERVYDATQRFRRKALMDRLPASVISQGDVVVVEAYLTRYKVDNDNTSGNKKRKGWDKWNTAFELLSVSILKHAPEMTESDEEHNNEGDFSF